MKRDWPFHVFWTSLLILTAAWLAFLMWAVVQLLQIATGWPGTTTLLVLAGIAAVLACAAADYRDANRW